MAPDPETYFITDHYLNYPYILVNLNAVTIEALKELDTVSCLLAKPTSKRLKEQTKVGCSVPRNDIFYLFEIAEIIKTPRFKPAKRCHS